METGIAKFGDNQYGVVTKNDMARLAAWAIGFAKANSHEAYEVRKLIRKLKPMLSPVDLVMLAEMSVEYKDAAWTDFSAELQMEAMKPPFKQE